MATKIEILAKIAQEARDGWKGPVGEKRAIDVVKFLEKTLENYAKVLNMSEDDIMAAMESRRDYTAINYYQESNFPHLENVVVFENSSDVLLRYPSKKYRCPSCNGISTNGQECNAVTENGDPCKWKSYGLFGTLGKGLRAVVKSTFLENPIVHEIFMPIEEESPAPALS